MNPARLLRQGRVSGWSVPRIRVAVGQQGLVAEVDGCPELSGLRL